jgi:hypothetical protein
MKEVEVYQQLLTETVILSVIISQQKINVNNKGGKFVIQEKARN